MSEYTVLVEESMRLQRAREALIQTGYFTPEQVGIDVAPRITELWSALTNKKVWLCEDDDDGLLNFVADSAETAILHLTKEIYANPNYIVTWSWVSDLADPPTYTVTGQFEAVQGWSTKHTAEFTIRSVEVVTA